MGCKHLGDAAPSQKLTAGAGTEEFLQAVPEHPVPSLAHLGFFLFLMKKTLNPSACCSFPVPSPRSPAEEEAAVRCDESLSVFSYFLWVYSSFIYSLPQK